MSTRQTLGRPPAQINLDAARELYQRHGAALRAEAGLMAALDAYARAIAATQALDRDLGLPALCGSCAASGQACCFPQAGQHYDPYLILMSLLLDAQLPETLPSPDDNCPFCGPTGCGLTAKHSFCHNFYCPAMKDLLGPERLGLLRAQVGRELSAQWELERLLLPWLWARGEA